MFTDTNDKWWYNRDSHFIFDKLLISFHIIMFGINLYSRNLCSSPIDTSMLRQDKWCIIPKVKWNCCRIPQLHDLSCDTPLENENKCLMRTREALECRIPPLTKSLLLEIERDPVKCWYTKWRTGTQNHQRNEDLLQDTAVTD